MSNLMHEPITPAEKIDGIARTLANTRTRQDQADMVQRLKKRLGYDMAREIRDRAVEIRRNRRRGRRVETPAARATDPATSHSAAEDVTRSGQRATNQRIVASTVAAHPGCTSRELTLYCSLDRYEIARRMSECVTAGTVARGKSRECAIGKRAATTWQPG